MGATQSLAQSSDFKLEFVARYASGVFGESAAEIAAFDPLHQRGFVVNARSGAVDVLDLADITNPQLMGQIEASSITPGATINSVALHENMLAIAIESAQKTDPGYFGLFSAESFELIAYAQVGAQPDMLTFTPDGRYLLVANEGEPSADYQIDPEGSVAVVDLADPQNPLVRIADFRALNGQAAVLRQVGVHLSAPEASVAQDLEPEYIAVSSDSRTAWVGLQENNAIAVIDIAAAEVTDLVALGLKNNGLLENAFGSGNGFDPSDADGQIRIRHWPGVYSLYQPDAIAAYEVEGATFLITANEGDVRTWIADERAYFGGDTGAGFSEEIRVKHLLHPDGFARRVGEDMPAHLAALARGAVLNPAVFAYCGAREGNPGNCAEDDILGRLKVSWTLGFRKDDLGNPLMFNRRGQPDPSGDRLMYDALVAFGGRSFSIWSEAGDLVWDSGDQFEQYLASNECQLRAQRDLACQRYFNTDHEIGNAEDTRSDDRGPEPEHVTIGKAAGRTFAFIGLERMGGVMVYDISNPQAPFFVDYLNTRENWDAADPSRVAESAGDIGPEGITFIAAEDSPSGEALLLVAHEVSGTTAIYRFVLGEN